RPQDSWDHARARGSTEDLRRRQEPGLCRVAAHAGAAQRVHAVGREHRAGKQIDVNIKYFHTLEYADGWYEFVFPMVVGPRFNPPGMTNGIGEVPRGKSGQSGQNTEVHYLAPGERSGHDIALKLDIDAGTPIEEFRCKTHDVTPQQPSPEHLSISLNQNDSLPNRD